MQGLEKSTEQYAEKKQRFVPIGPAKQAKSELETIIKKRCIRRLFLFFSPPFNRSTVEEQIKRENNWINNAPIDMIMNKTRWHL